jgi:hypothetical protein
MSQPPLALGPDEILKVVAIIAIAAVVITLVLAGVLKAQARERTRREIAAYVAEGSIDTAQARQLLDANPSEAEHRIAQAVSWGMISTAKAERLLRALRERPEHRGSGPADR